ncbi:hypothetical protein FRB94_013511 [Tulasnella sp. JGI-2019a]|nr:hypothetical protein FRB94_013511 [Tulasnella sp. JGI-2019a]
MNKGSVATATNNSVKPPVATKSAWAKGPPVPPQPPAVSSSSTTNTSRSNTPNPSANATPAHSRRQSTYGTGVAIKGQPRPMSASMSFGTIDNTTGSSLAITPAEGASPAVNGVAKTAPAPTTNAATTAPPVNFGSIASTQPAPPSSTTASTSANPSSAPSNSTATPAATNPAPTPAPRRKLDPNSLFQKQQPAVATQPAQSSTSGASPSNAAATAGVSSPQPRSSVPASTGHHSPYYDPRTSGPAPLQRPTPGAGGPAPRSPSFQRPPVNGITGNSNRPAPPQQNGSGIGSPRNGPPPLPQMQQQQPGGGVVPPPQQQQQQVQQQQPPPFSPQMQQQPPPWQGQYGWSPSPYQPYGYMVPQEQWGYPSPMQHHMHLPPHQQHPQQPHHLTQQQHSHPYGPPPTQHQQPQHSQPPSHPTPPITNQQAILPQQPPPPNVPPFNHQQSQSTLPPPQIAPATPMSPRPVPIPVVTPVTPSTPGPTLSTTNLRPSLYPPAKSLAADAQPFVPKKSSAIQIKNPETMEAVVFRPPDTGTPSTPHDPAGRGLHNRAVSYDRRDDAAFNPFPTIAGVNGKRATPIRMESPEDKARREEKEKEDVRKKEEAERKKKEEKEELERKKKEAEEEAERKRVEEERRIKEEEERIKREKEEAEEKERLEKIRQEEEEAAAKAKAEEEERLRIQKEKDEAEAAAKAKAEEEARLAKEQEEQRIAKEKAEAEKAAAAAAAAAKAESEAAAAPTTSSPKPPTPKPTLPPISTTSDNKPRRPVPGPLDLGLARQPGMPQPLPSALATARIIDDLDKVKYPEGIKTPDVELNQGAMQGGKFKYDRDFLLQFMVVCKDKPDHLPPLDALGIERDEAGGGVGFGGGSNGRGYNARRATGPPGSVGSTGRSMTSASVGLGISLPLGRNLPGSGGSAMGDFKIPALGGGRQNEDRSSGQNRTASAYVNSIAAGGTRISRTHSSGGGIRAPPMGGQDGVPQSPRDTTGRVRSQRGRQRNESLKPNQHTTATSAISSMQGQNQQQNGYSNNNQWQQSNMGLEPVLALQPTENRWPGPRAKATDLDEKTLVDRKVKSLLNKLTMEKFDSISDQIIGWANKSEAEADGKTLIQVIKLVFEKATDEATWSEMYAKLCRKMMEQISPDVRDEGVRNPDGKPIAGGQLFRKYLLNRCQEDFERGWSAKEAAVALAASKKAEDDTKAAAAAIAAAAAKAGGKEEEIVLYSDEYYAALKAKRQGLGLVKFIGELFKLQMLTERIMHECIKKLLSNVEDPEEEEIESLCKLLATVGQSLDTPKAKNHMDIYFARMDVLAKNPAVASRVQYMLLDVIEMRLRGWKARQAVAAPSTIAAVHEQAAKEKAAAEAATAYGRTTMSRGGSRRGEHTRGGDYSGQPGPDGWTAATGPAPRPPPAKAGDLSQFGKIAKSGGMMTMGPSSVFKKGERAVTGPGGSALGLGGPGRDASGPASAGGLSRAASGSNMFSLLNDAGSAEAAASHGSMSRSTSGRGAPRKPSVDIMATQSASSTAGAPPDTPLRRKIQLLPRSIPVSSDASNATTRDTPDGEDAGGSGASTPTELTTEPNTANSSMAIPAPKRSTAPAMSDEQAKTKVKEDVKEIFAVRNVSEAEQNFAMLPEEHHSKLVDAIVTHALDAKEDDVRLAMDVFAKVSGSVGAAAFESGFQGTAEFLEDIAIDVPQAYPRLARMLKKGAGLGRDAVERLAQKIAVEGDPLKHPKDKLLAEFDAA